MPSVRPHVAQVCVRAVDYVRQQSTKCHYVVQTTADPPSAGWVRNRKAQHQPHVEWLGECHWGDFAAPRDAGGVQYYEWGIGLSPGGTEVLPFQPSPYAREGAVPPLPVDSAVPYYCTVRAVTPAGVGVTASSPAFWACPAVATAAVTAHYRPGARPGARGTFCATWRVPPQDPGAACVTQVQWAVGHQPHGVSVMAFAEVCSWGPGQGSIRRPRRRFFSGGYGNCCSCSATVVWGNRHFTTAAPPPHPQGEGGVTTFLGGVSRSQHTNYWAPRTRKRHQQEHRPQRPTERSDPTQHAKGRTGDCPGPRKGATTRRNVTQGARQGGQGVGEVPLRRPSLQPVLWRTRGAREHRPGLSS